MRRREFLASGIGVVSLTAGCSSSDPGSGGGSTATETPTEASTPTATPPDTPTATPSPTATPALPASVEDPVENFDLVADLTDTDSLGVDETNPEYFPRQDNETEDAARFGRAGWADEVDPVTDDVAIVYGVRSVSTVSFEGHTNASNGGAFALEASTDGGESWGAVDLAEEVYNESDDSGDVGGFWTNAVYTASDFPEGTQHVRVVLSGSSAHWSPQVGHVTVE